MHDSDSQSDFDSTHRSLTTSRRRFLAAAAVGGTTLGGVFGTAGAQESTQIRLGARTRGWVGVQPSGIEDVTNPLLTLRPDQRYEVTVENLDGLTHNFVVQDTESRPVVESATLSERDETTTVEFVATEAMGSYVCQFHPSSMRGVLRVVPGTSTPTQTQTPTATGSPTETPTAPATETDTPTEAETDTPTEAETDTPTEAETDTATETEAETETDTETETEEATEELAPPSFEQERTEVPQGNLATFTVDLGGYEDIALRIGSQAVNYEIGCTVVDGDGDGQVTVTMDTFVAGRQAEATLSAAGDDEIRDVAQLSEPLPAPLDFAPYPIQALVSGEVRASSLLVLEPRSLTAANAAVAPQGVRPTETSDVREQIVRQRTVATGDWAVLDVAMAGLYASFDGVAALRDDSLGYELVIEEADVVNTEPARVPLSEVTLLTYPDDDRFLALVDSAVLDVGTTYTGSFTITDANPYVPAGEEERVETEFEVVERSASVAFEGEELTVPSAETTISGTATVAPGTELIVSAVAASETGFQQIERPLVGTDGTWTASFDFSTLAPETDITVSVLELGPPVQGRVVSG